MCAVKQLGFYLFFTVQIINVTIGKPLFLNHTIITSFLGASSAGFSHGFDENPLSENIAIVPSNKSEKLQQNFPDSTFSFPEESHTHFEYDITTTTEASNLLKKKVEKIIRKFVTVAQIKQAVSGKLQDDSGFKYPASPNSEATEIRVSKEYGEPLKIDLTKSAAYERKNNFQVKENEGKQIDEKVEPASLGIFILELFASVIGLTLGAAAQINHTFSHNNTV